MTTAAAGVLVGVAAGLRWRAGSHDGHDEDDQDEGSPGQMCTSSPYRSRAAWDTVARTNGVRTMALAYGRVLDPLGYPVARPLARGSTVEHLTLDQGVPGSNPGAPAKPPELTPYGGRPMLRLQVDDLRDHRARRDSAISYEAKSRMPSRRRPAEASPSALVPRRAAVCVRRYVAHRPCGSRLSVERLPRPLDARAGHPPRSYAVAPALRSAYRANTRSSNTLGGQSHIPRGHAAESMCTLRQRSNSVMVPTVRSDVISPACPTS